MDNKQLKLEEGSFGTGFEDTVGLVEEGLRAE